MSKELEHVRTAIERQVRAVVRAKMDRILASLSYAYSLLSVSSHWLHSVVGER